MQRGRVKGRVECVCEGACGVRVPFLGNMAHLLQVV